VSYEAPAIERRESVVAMMITQDGISYVGNND